MEAQTENKIVLITDDEAAKFVTNISGWVSRDGRFFGNDERSARYSGATHDTCKCGKIMHKFYTKCDDCRIKQEKEEYNKLPFGVWDGKVPVFSNACHEYFFDFDSIKDYLDDSGLMPEDLRLVLCVPNSFRQVDYDQWQDVMPEDNEELPKILQEALDVFNKVIDSLPPASWSPGNIRTEYKAD